MLLEKATEFINTMYDELDYSQEEKTKRLNEIENEINESGTYRHTTEELTYGARMAWRNSNRCIGRLFWETLIVQDARDVESNEAFIDAINTHLKEATNGGKIKSYITVFSQDNPPTIYNNQLIRYAGYEDKGDPAEKEITQLAEHLGWQGEGTDFDVLPLIYKLPYENQMRMYELPSELVLEVPIEHRNYPRLKELGIKWYAVPIISNMDLKIGGITYGTVPFNGWYMVNEIAVRNFTDSYRYNLIEKVADAFEFDTLKNTSFNKDRIVVELNDAVYHSFKKNGVSIVDHLTAAKQFEHFERNEEHAHRKVTGKWSWLVPSLSPTLVPNYHHGYSNEMREPNFFYKKKAEKQGCPFH
ncbi:nitric oxide synthase [Staphylococcus condimenti]|uniref:Nitric oxide synthase oxygenase n=1 Tax=Staphylococcus condimenti TaxID=70255 RepID=A0A143PF62_9STAP|nr:MULTISPECIES: nitric oxide synthase oxygenase [Staphylococcus]AMY06728.1 nitric oxide synthase [Staphylococcus condimenti]APR60630.1 nitric oxide synthase [Staphylococcus condimenti]MDK8645551.1 nitric oxide synthase oxygenase [Staphylococcus condimenti]OFP00429.1 nitric oxide synthase [Staphylococcus sp. HMSC065E08]PNZ60672.1 nitric oxide synthase [Staphylococcus condimenti]